ncbi:MULTISPECIES: hypothetical protein [Oceanospirillaceae]|jgi:hypothetical protein|uniref:Transcriptional regulator SutA RNAP-binding domain-containing protein n=1 Tax=Oceanobacter antarcticus TaxID=3133425 RepID=A0ABW8NFK6_9GAMM|tara:strand:+ start:4099 stop:4377 length:279 start_codon:yes stop_codon:yes gene_type:complete
MSDDDFEIHDDETDQDADGDARPQVKKRGATKASDQDDSLQVSSTAHNELRDSLEGDVEAFLSRGGRIQQVDDNVMADPPRKPQSNYGSRPI